MPKSTQKDQTPAELELAEATALLTKNLKATIQANEALSAARESYRDISARSATDASLITEAHKLRRAVGEAEGVSVGSHATLKTSENRLARAEALVELERLGVEASETHVPDLATYQAMIDQKVVADLDALIHPLFEAAQGHDTTIYSLSGKLDRARKDSRGPLPHGIQVNQSSIYLQGATGELRYGPHYASTLERAVKGSIDRFKAEKDREIRDRDREALEAKQAEDRALQDDRLKSAISTDTAQARQEQERGRRADS